MALNRKQRQFCLEYVKCFNATEAAKRAGYSDSTAYSQGSRLLKDVEIKEYIQHEIDQRTPTEDEILARMGDISRASYLPFVNIADDGHIYFDFSNPQARNYLHLIKKIKSKRRRTVEGQDGGEWEQEWVEVELHDSMAALTALARIKGMFADKVDVTTNGKDISQITVYIPTNGRE